MVDVVGKHSIRNVDDEVVHLHILSWFLFAVCQGPDSVEGMGAFVDVPFVLS